MTGQGGTGHAKGIGSTFFIHDPYYFVHLEKSNGQDRPGYSIPNPMLSDRQAIRYAHQDLPALADLELWREKHLIEDAVASNPQHPWLRERYQHIIGEEMRRKRGRI